MKRLSATEYVDYCKCPRMWYFRYVLSIPQRDSSEMNLGRIWHEFQELYHMGATMEEFLKALEVTGDINDKDKHMLKNMMINYQKYDNLMNENKYEEQRRIPKNQKAEFLYEYKFEDKKTFFDKDIVLVGKIDMAFIKGDVLTIIDHKTASDMWSIPMINMSPQAEFYHVLISNAFSEDPDYKYIKSVEFLWNIAIKKVGTRSDIYDCFQRERIIYPSVKDNLRPLVQVIDQMQSYNELPYRSAGPQCMRCSYLSYCMVGNNIAGIANLINSEVKF